MRLFLATTNRDKIREYRQLLKGISFTVPRKLPEVEETGKTFRSNAVIKAKAYGRHFGRPVITDDTGLEIKALNGFPGIYSNRFAKGDFVRARGEILKMMAGRKNRRARFVCVIALFTPDSGEIKTFTGTVSGRIAVKETGGLGFGYDPIFVYPGLKMLVSHRARAAARLTVFLKAAGKPSRF